MDLTITVQKRGADFYVQSFGSSGSTGTVERGPYTTKELANTAADDMRDERDNITDGGAVVVHHIV